MAAIVIPNQPFKLIENGETLNERNARQMWDRRQFCQLVKTSQTQQFQLRVTEDSGNNEIANGDFLQAGMSSWTVYPNASGVNQTVINLNGRAYFIPDFGATVQTTNGGMWWYGYISQSLTLSAYTYKLTLDLYFYADDAGGEQQVRIFLTNATQIGGNASVYNTTQNGTVSLTLYFRVTGVPNVLSIYFDSRVDGGTGFEVDNISLVQLTEPVLSLQDCNGNYIKDVNIVERFEDRVTYTHSWADMTDGQCYQFCLLGGDDLAANHVEGSFCLTDERGRVLLDENGDCIQFEIT